MVEELKQKLETRKFQLINMLKFDNDTIALERQHQIYGAIKELDMILSNLIQYQLENTKGDFELQGLNKKDLMNKLATKLR